MRQIFFLLICIIINITTSKEILQFKETQILQVEDDTKKYDFLFVLFFDRQDGLTEDIQRQFIKAQKMLQDNDNIDIEVLSLHKKLSLRLEKIFKVFEIPKVKFFRKNFKPQTYDGAIKPNAIRQWVKKNLRKKPFESIEIYETKGFVDNFSNDRENIFAVYFDQYDTKQFQLYEKFAMSKDIACYRSQNKLIFSILQFLQSKQQLVDERKFKEMIKMNKKQIKEELFQDIQILDKIQPSLFFVKFIKFQKQLYIEIINVQKFNAKILKQLTKQIKQENFQPNGLKYIENIQKLKGGDITYAFTFNTNNLSQALELRSLQFNKTTNKILMIDLKDQLNNPIIQNLLYNIEESFYIFELDFKQNLRLFKQNINYDDLNDAQIQIKNFIEKYQKKELKEYMKSKCPETETYYGKFKETCSELIYDQIEANNKKKLILFLDNQKNRTELILKYMEDYYSNLHDIEYYAINVNENKTDLAVNKTYPYIKLFLDGKIEKTRGINFSYNRSNYDHFFNKYFKIEEL